VGPLRLQLGRRAGPAHTLSITNMMIEKNFARKNLAPKFPSASPGFF
jgi:hypothetical protein